MFVICDLDVRFEFILVESISEVVELVIVL